MSTPILRRALVAAALATLAGACNFSQEPAPEQGLKLGHVRITKTGTEMGAVTFFHRGHKKHALEKQKCQTCHHVGKWEQACGDAGCHRDAVLDAEGQRLHQGCIDKCHRETGGSAPTDCGESGCHLDAT